MPAYQKAKRLSIFLSMPEREISTTAIVENALQNGKVVFVPYLRKENKRIDMEMRSLLSLDDFRSLRPDAWNIPSLDPDSIEKRENAIPAASKSIEAELGRSQATKMAHGLDLVLIPALAFDGYCGRLGHGKGFYDRYLHDYERLMIQTGVRPAMPILGERALFPWA